MSNYILDSVLAEDLKSEVWGKIVVSANGCITWQDGSIDVKMSMERLSEEVRTEHLMANDYIGTLDMPDAERESLTEKLLREVGNIVKNYFPVIKRTLKDGLPLLDSDGKAVTKSQMEKNYKSKELAESDKSPEEKAMIMGRTFVAFCNKHELDINDYLGVGV